MREDYLWDRSGPPDPEIESLEKALAPLRYRHRAGVLPASPRNTRPFWAAVAAAAAVLTAIAIPLSRFSPALPATGWQVTGSEGQAHLGDRDVAVDMAVGSGQLVRTGNASHVSLRADRMGIVDIGADSQLRATDRHMTLERGLLHAFIWARPRQFVVDTPSARAVDLGCEYTLKVDPSGNGLLRVSMGWVAFQFHDAESFIPAGAACVTRKKQGTGIPYYEDAAEGFRRSLASFEEGDAAAVPSILAQARSRDGLTLWHLLTRVAENDRAAVYDRFVQLVSVPPDVRREAVLRRDPHAIDQCWNALNLEDTAWWRGWERRW